MLRDLKEHTRILLLPGQPSRQLVEALGKCRIELHGYELARGRRRASARFTAAFLQRCGVPAARVTELVAGGVATP